MRYGSKIEWTDDQVTRLQALFADGLSAGQIAAEMGLSGRGAIVGKLHRLGLKRGVTQNRMSQSNTMAARRPRVARRAAFRAPPEKLNTRATAAPPATSEPAGDHRCDLMGLRNSSCRWIVSGEGEPFRYCGEPEADLANGVSYCRHHHRRAHDRSRDVGEAA